MRRRETKICSRRSNTRLPHPGWLALSAHTVDSFAIFFWAETNRGSGDGIRELIKRGASKEQKEEVHPLQPAR